MKKLFCAFLLTMVLACCSGSSDNRAQSSEHGANLPAWQNVEIGSTIEVLFVGNSYTFYHDMPDVVEDMAASTGVTVTTEMSVFPGVDWSFHTDTDNPTLDEIASGAYDVVVLQNHSLSARDQEDDFMLQGVLLVDAVNQAGAIPVLYETWARQDYSITQDTISTAYGNLAEQEEILVVPVGTIWQHVRDTDSDLGNSLFDPDGSHPSEAGSYLIASVFYRFLTGQETAEIPAELESIEIAPQTADDLQRYVDEFELQGL